MADNQPPPSTPLLLDLAPLPREQLGPFVILGLNKRATKEEIEANWAQRVIWARKNQIATPLEDINWAREVLSDADKRARADAASLNLDLGDGFLRRLDERYRQGPKLQGSCQPMDVEKPLADYSPPIPIPDPEEIRQHLSQGEIPLEIPAIARILEEFAQTPLDPWKLDLSP